MPASGPIFSGFTQVNVLRRGMEQWNEEKLPTEGRAAMKRKG